MRKNIWKQMLSGMVSVLTITVMTVTSLGVGGIRTEAAPKIGESANLVVLVKFQGDDRDDEKEGYNCTYNSSIAGAPTTQWEYLQRKFNGENDPSFKGSFKEYFKAISNEQHLVTSYFPQTDPTTQKVKYLEMSKPVEQYQGPNGEANLVEEICGKLNATYPNYNGAELDKDNDEYVDNLLILASVQDSGKYTPHSTNHGGTHDFAGKKIGYYNIIETRTSVVSGNFIDTFDINTAAHEYIHTFDIPDYYRNVSGGNNNPPVGLWDPMGSPSGRPYPLAVTREEIGWRSAIPVKDSVTATYTLYTVQTADNDADKEQALKFYTPLSDSEYFVVEYRKKGTPYTAELDQSVPGDGVIIYRVNPAYKTEGNLNGHDYIYVFHPGETAPGASDGQLENAQVGLASHGATREETGSTELSATIAQGAICYSDGRNSGMQLKVTKQTNDSITFQVTFPDYTTQDLWDNVKSADGTTPFAGLQALDTKTVTDGKMLYVLAEENKSAKLFSYDGQDWKDLGAVANAGASYDMCIYQNELYLLMSDWNGNNTLKKYTGSGLVNVAAVANTMANAPRLGVAGGSLYALLDNGNNMQLYRLEGSSLQAVGNTIQAGTLADPRLYEENGEIAAVYGNMADGGSLNSVKLDQENWSSQFQKSGSPTGNSVAVKDGKKYLLSSYQSTNPVLRVWESADQVTEYSLTGIPSGATFGDLTLGEDYLYITIMQNQDAELVTYSAPLTDPGTLTLLGSSVGKPAGKGSTELLGDTLYCAVVPQNMGEISVKSHAALKKQPTPTAAPTAPPTVAPTTTPTTVPTAVPTAVPTTAPTTAPTMAPTNKPDSGSDKPDGDKSTPAPGTATPPATTTSPGANATSNHTSESTDSNHLENVNATATPMPAVTASPVIPVKPQGGKTATVTEDDGQNGNVDQGGIHDLFDDGAALVERTPAPEEDITETTETIAYEVVDTHQKTSRKPLIAGIVVVIAIVTVVNIGYAVYKARKERE